MQTTQTQPELPSSGAQLPSSNQHKEGDLPTQSSRKKLKLVRETKFSPQKFSRFVRWSQSTEWSATAVNSVAEHSRLKAQINKFVEETVRELTKPKPTN